MSLLRMLPVLPVLGCVNAPLQGEWTATDELVNGSSAWSNSIFDGSLTLDSALSGSWNLAFYEAGDKETDKTSESWAGTASGQAASSCVDSLNTPAEKRKHERLFGERTAGAYTLLTTESHRWVLDVGDVVVYRGDQSHGYATPHELPAVAFTMIMPG